MILPLGSTSTLLIVIGSVHSPLSMLCLELFHPVVTKPCCCFYSDPQLIVHSGCASVQHLFVVICFSNIK